MEVSEKPTRQHNSYWTLIRDVGVLQVKLLIDGFRDVILLPASLIAGLVSLVNGENGKPGPQFYRLIAVGKRSERMINLFGAIRNSPERIDEKHQFANVDIDDIVSRVETFIIDEYKRGGVTRQAKDRIDKALAAIERGRQRRQ